MRKNACFGTFTNYESIVVGRNQPFPLNRSSLSSVDITGGADFLQVLSRSPVAKHFHENPGESHRSRTEVKATLRKGQSTHERERTRERAQYTLWPEPQGRTQAS